MAKPSSREVVLPVPRGYRTEVQTKAMFGTIRRDMGQILKELCRRFEVELVEGHVMADHVQNLASRPSFPQIGSITRGDYEPCLSHITCSKARYSARFSITRFRHVERGCKRNGDTQHSQPRK